MRPSSVLSLAFEALVAHRLRSALSALAIAVGVSAVVLLTSIGEGTRRFVVDQVSSFGTTIVGVHPGKVSTTGIPGAMGGSARKLTLADAEALRRLPGVAGGVACAYGTARVEHGARARHVLVAGVTADMPRQWSMPVATGHFLPDVGWDRAVPVVVLGARVQRELFGNGPAVGQSVRIGDTRFRVVGILRPKGQFLGTDLDDAVYVPTRSAMRLFDLDELSEIHLRAASPGDVDRVAESARDLILERHRRDDVTIVRQKDAMRMLDDVLRVLAAVVTGIAAISLIVGAIGIFTILWIVVDERVSEIGLVKAIGGTRCQIAVWYLSEAALLGAVGGAAGLVAGAGGAALLARMVPGLEAHTPPGVVVVALVVAIGVALLSGLVPAMRAARLDPIEALRTE